MNMNPKTTAFLAGLFEGDGYFGAVQFKLGLRDRDIVEYVAELLNTKVRTITPALTTSMTMGIVTMQLRRSSIFMAIAKFPS